MWVVTKWDFFFFWGGGGGGRGHVWSSHRLRLRLGIVSGGGGGGVYSNLNVFGACLTHIS